MRVILDTGCWILDKRNVECELRNAECKMRNKTNKDRYYILETG